MKIGTTIGAALLVLGAAGSTAIAKETAGARTSTTSDVSLVGGAEMYPSKTIVANAVNSPIHTTLVSAVKAAGLVDTLNGPGPFTVFAPTDAAFAKVPAATLQTLMDPANKALLTKVLTFHVVPGRLTASDLLSRVKAGGGTATLTTVEGETLMLHQASGGGVMIMGKGGSTATVTQADVMQSNGVIHVLDGVLTPTL